MSVPALHSIADLAADLHLLRAAPSDDVQAVYDRAASSYDRFRERWLEVAGRSAEQAMLDDLAAVLTPGARVLDAGCGTGALSRQILAVCPAVDLTMLDLSREMLARTADLPGQRLQGSMLELPFADDAFDVVVSAWVIETVADPRAAVTELRRVLAPDGVLVYTFCSLPESRASRAGSALLRSVVKHSFAGEFLDDAHTPWHDCARSHRQSFHGGLTTEIALGKCCDVDTRILPTAVDATTADRPPRFSGAAAGHHPDGPHLTSTVTKS
jgi:ubiquinone/menaquinone biosynthesis C-methylase UbiE